MDKFTLSLTQAQSYVRSTVYDLDLSARYISRCIDGRYESAPALPALAMAGGDAGELAVFMAAANVYGFELNVEKFMKTLTELVGGEKRLGLHTDTHVKEPMVCAGCGHVKQMRKDPQAYSLTAENIQALDEILGKMVKKGAQEVCLQGDHHEAAVLLVNGPHGVLPQARIDTDEGSLPVQVFIAHKSLIDARHVELCERLVAEGAVKLAEGLGQEYLYECVSQVADDHLMETATRLAAGLPIYAVHFKDEGSFNLEDMGTVPA